jgi:hypothetical protein
MFAMIHQVASVTQAMSSVLRGTNAKEDAARVYAKIRDAVHMQHAIQVMLNALASRAIRAIRMIYRKAAP